MQKIDRLVAIVLSLALTMSFMLVGNADEISEKYISGPSTNIPFAVFGLDLLEEKTGVGETSSNALKSYTQTFTCEPQVDCNLNFQIYKNSPYDKHQNNGKYIISVKKGSQNLGVISEEQAKNFALSGKSKYYFTVTRNYISGVNEVYIGIITKLNPDPVSEGFSASYTGDSDISKYYSFTPTHDGGYLFKLTPNNSCIGANKNYILTIYSKVGSSVNEFASYEKDVSESNLRLYLKSGVEYIIKAQGFGATGLGYSFAVETVPNGPSLSLVGAPTLALNTEKVCTLYPFANRQAFAWYTFTAPKDGCYEFYINNRFDAGKNGDIIVEIRDDTFSPIQDEDIVYVFENETGILSKVLKEGETCYLQVAEQYKGSLQDVYNVGITAREHTHTNEIVIDGNYVIKGCACQNEEAMYYAFWLDEVKVNDATYTGKAVKPKVTLGISESYCKDGMTIPGIPKSAYSVTLTSKNKKNIGMAKAKVKFTGEYKGLGSYNVSFKIVPKGTTIRNISAGDKSFKVKWKKQIKKTSGYEIRYSQYEGMYNVKTVSVSNNKTLYKKVGNLKSNTDYYVQVRTYMKANGKKYCSTWSTKKKVTIN